MCGRGTIAFSIVAGLGVVLAEASFGYAQAWLPPKGESWFTLGYGNVYTRDHLFSKGERVDQGRIRSHIVAADVGYSITNRLAVLAGIPYVTSKYEGSFPHQFPVDDGSYHGTFQDFRFGVRFNAMKAPVVLTPFVIVQLPSHGYEYFGHAIPGTGLKQLQVGLGFGWRSDTFLPDGYVQGRYSYAFVEKIEGVYHDRSNLDLQLGYFVKPTFQVFALAMGQKSHGGLVFYRPDVRAKWTAFDFHHHGQLARTDLLGFGGGAGLQLTPYLDVTGTYMTTVAGRNDHANNGVFALGITLGFSPRQVLRLLSRRPPPATPGS